MIVDSVLNSEASVSSGPPPVDQPPPLEIEVDLDRVRSSPAHVGSVVRPHVHLAAQVSGGQPDGEVVGILPRARMPVCGARNAVGETAVNVGATAGFARSWVRCIPTYATIRAAMHATTTSAATQAPRRAPDSAGGVESTHRRHRSHRMAGAPAGQSGSMSRTTGLPCILRTRPSASAPARLRMLPKTCW